MRAVEPHRSVAAMTCVMGVRVDEFQHEKLRKPRYDDPPFAHTPAEHFFRLSCERMFRKFLKKKEDGQACVGFHSIKHQSW